jgi:hypothetical protein
VTQTYQDLGSLFRIFKNLIAGFVPRGEAILKGRIATIVTRSKPGKHPAETLPDDAQAEAEVKAFLLSNDPAAVLAVRWHAVGTDQDVSD